MGYTESVQQTLNTFCSNYLVNFLKRKTALGKMFFELPQFSLMDERAFSKLHKIPTWRN